MSDCVEPPQVLGTKVPTDQTVTVQMTGWQIGEIVLDDGTELLQLLASNGLRTGPASLDIFSDVSLTSIQLDMNVLAQLVTEYPGKKGGTK